MLTPVNRMVTFESKDFEIVTRHTTRRRRGSDMGALYIIGSIVLAGIAFDMFSTLVGEDTAERYDYHFAMGVGAVFGETR